MTIIKEVITFKVDGKEFRTLLKVKAHVENELGGIIDSIQPRIAPKQALQILDALIQNRGRLAELLGVEYELYSSNALQQNYRSIFEL